jgi:hypothetical protein
MWATRFVMRVVTALATFVAAILLSTICRGEVVYYIDFDDGNDSNSGLSRSQAWRTIPGTRTVDAADWIETQWGPPGDIAVNSFKEVQPGTVFKLKRGVVHDSATGGQVLIDSVYYSDTASAAAPIVFELDEEWGSGSIVFDGTGVELNRFGGSSSGYGLIHLDIGGVNFDGKVPGGMIVRNSWWMGISCYAKSVPLPGCSFRYIKFFNNGTEIMTDQEGAGSGQLYIKNHVGGVVDSCEFDGNKGSNGFINGLQLGQSSRRVLLYQVSNCVSYNHKGTNDAGMGFKAVNSEVTYKNCVAYGNYKGWDLGENEASPSLDITYKTINCEAYDNTYGINLNGPFDPSGAEIEWTGSVKFYVINCIVRDNYWAGSHVYAGPFDIYIVHSVFDNNGDGLGYANLTIGPDGDEDHNRINAYLYNNIFYKPNIIGNRANFICPYWVQGDTEPANDSCFDLDSDYNAWIQNSSEYFCLWGFWGDGDDRSYSYGLDGPGHGAGSAWYDEYGGSVTVPPNGSTGHQGADEHSMATGGDSFVPPPFKSVSTHDYRLTTCYSGVDLSSKSWYIAEMGFDRDGNKRSSWELGGYEFIEPVVLSMMKSPGGGANLSWNVKPNRSYVVRWSEDLKNWDQVAVGSSQQWEDSDTGIYARRFYQVYEYELEIYKIESVGGPIRIYWNGQPGLSYVILWSENLADWREVPVGMVSDWTDTDTAGFKHKFYKVYEE